MRKKSRNFAIKSHQNQKYGIHPYSYHLDAVAKIAEPYGDIAVVISYLHDVVEDTSVSLSTIEREFGKFVSDCVGILTDEDGKDRAECKSKTYAKMAKVTGDLELALLVKACDRLANIRACVSDKNHEKLVMYKSEFPIFRESVFRERICDDIWAELEGICRV
jgi:(p)ppGpp synthase/HD superfamily hydrolase